MGAFWAEAIACAAGFCSAFAPEEDNVEYCFAPEEEEESCFAPEEDESCSPGTSDMEELVDELADGACIPATAAAYLNLMKDSASSLVRAFFALGWSWESSG